MKKEIVQYVNQEIRQARRKFPKSRLLLTAFTEECGEVVQKVLNHYNTHKISYSRAERNNIYAEIIQVMAMCVRLLEEGDPIHEMLPIIKR